MLKSHWWVILHTRFLHCMDSFTWSYLTRSFCLCKYNIAECPDSLWFVRGCPDAVAAVTGVVGLFFTCCKWFSVNTNRSGCAWVCKKGFTHLCQRDPGSAVHVGKQVFVLPILLPFFFWRLTWIYGSWAVHDKKMFMQYQLVKTHKPSVQHEKSLAAPKCMNNLKWYVRCKGEDRTKFLLEIFWLQCFFKGMFVL